MSHEQRQQEDPAAIPDNSDLTANVKTNDRKKGRKFITVTAIQMKVAVKINAIVDRNNTNNMNENETGKSSSIINDPPMIQYIEAEKINDNKENVAFNKIALYGNGRTTPWKCIRPFQNSNNNNNNNNNNNRGDIAIRKKKSI